VAQQPGHFERKEPEGLACRTRSASYARFRIWQADDVRALILVLVVAALTLRSAACMRLFCAGTWGRCGGGAEQE
jgi:hypothetical protein